MLFDKLPLISLASSNWFSGFYPCKVEEPHSSLGVTDSSHFAWDDISANESLVYHDCFDGFQCARLRVPMDWLADPGTDSRTVDIAVIRLPATVPVTDPRYGGPILLNPGGPGGSGVRLALGGGKSIRTILSGSSSINSSSPTFTSAGSNYITDDETEKHFDVISFDPRGVNNTRPFFACFPDSTQNIISELEDLATGVYGSSDTAFDTHWAKARALASDCSKRAMESGIGEHMATASVARDIIEIVERHGEWREKEVQNYLQTLSPAHPSRFRSGAQEILVEKDVRDLINRTRYMPNEEKVQYWGFSYGTILGATLAAMFPERMERIVLDGVADSFDYMRGGWLTNLQDTDMQLVKFGEYCWVGGPKNCALYHEDGPAVILETFMGVVQSLKKTPLSVPGTGHSAAGVATYSDLKDLFFSKTYKPLQNFHNMSIIMKELSQGNGTGLMQAKLEKRKVLEKGLSEQCLKDGPYMPSCFNSTAGYDMSVGSGILCTDAEPQTNVTKEEYWDYVQELMGQSVLLGDSWGTIRAPCTQWHARPKWRYEGNFTAQTSHPILFVSNTHDNVTPLRNAHRMALGFAGSTVLQQDSEGHCSISSPSFCTARVLRRYFQTGRLPDHGQVCAPDRRPLDGFSEEVEPRIPDGEVDEPVWRAMVQLALR